MGEDRKKDKELESMLKAHTTVIKVVGTGGAGNNTISRLLETGVKGVTTVAINTDAQDLLFTQADEKVLIGRNITNGLGAGGDPQIGEEAAKESMEEIKASLESSDMVFITCGLGGGTGTGSAPIIAEVAKALGALTISIVTLPFTEEGIIRWNNAREGLTKLKKSSDTVIVVQNDKLLETVPDLPLNEAFRVADEILSKAVKGIAELVTQKGLVNLDFADIQSIMREGGTAMIGVGESGTGEKTIEAVEKAIKNPLLDMDITGAKSALIHITGGPNMSIREAKMVMKAVAQRLHPSAKIIWGARVDEKIKDTIRVMLIATGLKVKEGVSPERTEKPRTKPSPKVGKHEHKKEAKKVFAEILKEEADNDLKAFKDAIELLKRDAGDLKAWQDVKNSCSTLQVTAQMFDFKMVGELLSSVENIIDVIMTNSLDVPQNFINILENIPNIILGMIDNQRESLREGEGNIEKLRSLRSFLEERQNVSHQDFEKAVEGTWEGEKILETNNGDGKGCGVPFVEESQEI